MGRKRDPNSRAEFFRGVNERTGIPVNVLRTREYVGMPLDAPYVERARGSLREQVSRALRSAKRAGKTRYEGTPCVKCGGVIRYTASSNCVVCIAKK